MVTRSSFKSILLILLTSITCLRFYLLVHCLVMARSWMPISDGPKLEQSCFGFVCLFVFVVVAVVVFFCQGVTESELQIANSIALKLGENTERIQLIQALKYFPRMRAL